MELLKTFKKTLLESSEKKSLSSLELERKILKTQGLIENKNVYIYDIFLSSKEHIHTIEAGKFNSVPIILLHGYGVTAVSFAKMIAQLKDKFHIFAIDLPGNGNSSRPTFNKYEYEDAVDYFILKIEEWRKKLKINNFHLIGHSFGGYLAVQYVRKIPIRIKYLHLICPAGFTYKNIEKLEIGIEASHNDDNMSFKQTLFLDTVVGVLKISPFNIIKLMNKKNYLLKCYNAEKLNLLKEETWLYTQYYMKVMNKKHSGEKAVTSLLHFGKYSKRPLANQIQRLKIDNKLPPISIYYGAEDWMDKDHSKKINEDLGLGLDIQIIPNCGHQLIFQIPVEISKRITWAECLDFFECEIDVKRNIQIYDIMKDTKYLPETF